MEKRSLRSLLSLETWRNLVWYNSNNSLLCDSLDWMKNVFKRFPIPFEELWNDVNPPVN